MKYSILAGPLGSHLNYITHIALENCEDYFVLVRMQEEQGQNQDSQKYRRFRLFLNAIESMNNILDYFYYEFEEECDWSNKGNIIGRIRENHPILKTISEIANAYKHCKTAKSKKNAADLQKPAFNVNVNLSGADVEVKYEISSIEDRKLLEEAFVFWLNYLNDPQPDFLLRDLELSRNIHLNVVDDPVDMIVRIVSQSLESIIRKTENS